MKRRSSVAGILVVVMAGLIFNGCGSKPDPTAQVIEDRDGDIYTLTVGRDSKIFDLSKIEDQMKLAKFQEKYREALENHQRQKEAQVRQQQEMYKEDVQVDQAGQGEGVVRSYP